MACHLFSAEPLREPSVTLQIRPSGTVLTNFKTMELHEFELK